MSFDVIKIKDLQLKTFIGVFDWEQKKKQKVLINLQLEFDASLACVSDQISDTVDYKKISKEIIVLVENNRYLLIEKMAADILNLIMQNKRIQKVGLEIDKPGALRFARSVSFSISRTR